MFDFNTYMPTRILLGKDKIDSLGSICRIHGNRAIVITGKHSMKLTGYTERVIRLLKEENIETALFDRVESNPSRITVNAAAEAAKEFGAQMVIGLGGGSVLDTAKGVAVVAKMGGDIWDYVTGKEILPDVLPVIALPSTAGTGSEVTPYTVISDAEQKRKNGFASEWIIPKAAIIDSLLMSTAPSDLTAKAGGDVLAQAVEAYTSKLAHDYSDLLALESIWLCGKYLRRVVEKKNDLEARAAIGWASTLSGMAIACVDVVIGHHASEAVGAIYGTHHGETAAALLVPTLLFNFDETEDRLAAIGEALGMSFTGSDATERAHTGVDAVRALLTDIGLPTKLSTLGVGRDSIPALLEILLERNEDLQSGNPHWINEESIGEFLDMAM